MNIWRKLAIIAGGYFVAILVATVVTTFCYLAPMALPDQGQFGSIYGWWSDIPMFLMIGSFYTFLFALPGFVVAVWLGEWLKWKAWTPYSFAGALDAFLAHLLLANFFSASFTEFRPLIVASIIGGFVGGAAYWFAAGRFVAQRRKPKITSPAPSES